jgi:hypothetical protein
MNMNGTEVPSSGENVISLKYKNYKRNTCPSSHCFYIGKSKVRPGTGYEGTEGK